MRPKPVRRSVKSAPTTTMRKMSSASGRPLYWFSTYAGTYASTASTAVRRMISLSGRDGTPAASRRLAPKYAAAK